MTTVSVFDVATFILREKQAMSTMKLQKLLHYCQAWSLVWDGSPLCAVLRYYGNKPSQWLSDLTHLESSWRDARKGVTEKDSGNREISLISMESYHAAAYDEGVEIEV